MAYFVHHRMERLANSSMRSDDSVTTHLMDPSAIWRYVMIFYYHFIFLFTSVLFWSIYSMYTYLDHTVPNVLFDCDQMGKMKMAARPDLMDIQWVNLYLFIFLSDRFAVPLNA